MRLLARGALEAILALDPDDAVGRRAVAPAWVREFVETVPFEPVVVWDFHHPAHINVLESR
eukprot:8815543-Lingulodinium_polyedra.AAC.1